MLLSTGKLDEPTLEKMRQPRCGNPDDGDGVQVNKSNAARAKRYILHGRFVHGSLLLLFR